MEKLKQIENYVDSRIKTMISLEETGKGKKMYADLRRGVGKHPGENPELWGTIFLDLPDELCGNSIEPQREEWACYIALTLYAVHQQGHDVKKSPMHSAAYNLGSALKKLVETLNDSSAEKRVLQKLKILSSAKSISELSYYLRSIIKMLSSKGIPLDYAKLAGDIYLLQFPEQAANIRLNWGRNFYNPLSKEKEMKNEGE